MSFAALIQRLEVSMEDRRYRQGDHVMVLGRDLEEALRQFKRLDAASRLMYEPHLKLMRAATETLRTAVGHAAHVLNTMGVKE